MIVCNCFNIRESDLATLAREGRACMKSIRQTTGLGTHCGKCIPYARAILDAKSLASGPTPIEFRIDQTLRA